MRRIVLLKVLLVACGGGSGSEGDVDAAAKDAAPGIDSNAAVACVGEGAADQALPIQDTCNSDPGITLGQPITDVEAETNPHHIRFTDTRCMNGEGLEGNSGITLRIQPGATKLLIYLQGGGLCADDTTCAGVRNPDGLSLDPNVLIIRDWTLEGGVFFADPLFADAHQVFVHYCSGDVHAGNSPTPVVAPGSAIDGRVYTGRENLKAFLSRLVPTFGAGGLHPVDQVVLAGSSAGGMGTVLNHHVVQQAFGCTPVHAFIDSPPPFGLIDGCLQSKWNDIMNLDGSMPADCQNCSFAGGDANGLIRHMAESFPGRRFGWFSSTQDCVLRGLLGLASDCGGGGEPSAAAFETGINELRDELRDLPNFRTFFYAGDWHTVPIPPAGLGDEIKGPDAVSDRRLMDIVANGESLATWISDLRDPTKAWSHICDEVSARDELLICN